MAACGCSRSGTPARQVDRPGDRQVDRHGGIRVGQQVEERALRRGPRRRRLGQGEGGSDPRRVPGGGLRGRPRPLDRGVAPSLACPRGVGTLSGGSGHEVPHGAQLTRPDPETADERYPARYPARCSASSGRGSEPLGAPLNRQSRHVIDGSEQRVRMGQALLDEFDRGRSGRVRRGWHVGRDRLVTVDAPPLIPHVPPVR